MKNKSYWQKQNKYFSFQNKNNKNCDVLIIGGGMTGIMSAYELSKQSNLSIILTTSNHLAMDISAKTTAKITPMHNLMYQDIAKIHGHRKAKQYYQSQVDAMNHIVSIINQEKIDCDLQESNNYMYAQTTQGYKKLKKEYQTLKKLKIDAELVNQIPINLEIIKAIKYDSNYSFHPIKYLNHIIKILQTLPNVSILEGYHLSSFKKENRQYIVNYTNHRTIKAKHMIVASHYPIFVLPGLYASKLYQEKTYLAAFKTTKVINDLYINTDEPVHSLRCANDKEKSIAIFAGNSHIAGKKHKYSQNPSAQLIQEIKKFDANATIIDTWTNQDVLSIDYLPYIGRYSRLYKHIYVATSFSTWGMTNSHVASLLLKDIILGKKNKYQELYNSQRLSHILSPIESIKQIARAIDGLLIKRLRFPKQIRKLANGEGDIVSYRGIRYACYNDGKQYYLLKPSCSHTKCFLHFNALEKTWDCPCHGSRFDVQGNVINGPANKALSKKVFAKHFPD